jgi:hypothetical protein
MMALKGLLQSSVGEPTFPASSLSELICNTSVRAIQGGIDQTSHSVSQVGKAGLPLLLDLDSQSSYGLLKSGCVTALSQAALAFEVVDDFLGCLLSHKWRQLGHRSGGDALDRTEVS